jgi:steroid delta-isomerase-like uncharacterized protein
MSVNTNKELSQRAVAAFNSQNFDALDGLYASDYTHHDPSLPPEVQQGLANYKQGIAMFFTAFPDLHGTADDVVAEGDRVVTRLTWQGTQLGSLMGAPPSGKKASFSMIQILRCANDQIVEGWVVFDLMGMLTQVGMIPSAGR